MSNPRALSRGPYHDAFVLCETDLTIEIFVIFISGCGSVLASMSALVNLQTIPPDIVVYLSKWCLEDYKLNARLKLQIEGH
jgi:hypothetical protein